MKKITLQVFSFLCLIASLSYSQTYTGPFSIGGVVNGQIDINTTTNIVTLTLIGPSSGWLAMGLDTNSHSNGKDVVIFDGSTLSDRTFSNGYNTPSLDGQQDWTITSNTTSGSTRTIVATRARDTGDSSDYIFPTSPSNLNVVGAYRNNFTISEHAEFGGTTISFTVLGLEDFNKIQFSMSPNPANSNLKIVLPSHLNNSTIEIVDVLGRQIYNGNLINTNFSVIDVSAWSSGTYLVKVLNEISFQTKRFVKQ